MQVSKILLLPILIPLWFAFLPFRFYKGFKNFIGEVNRKRIEKYGTVSVTTKTEKKKDVVKDRFQTLVQLEHDVEVAEKKRMESDKMYQKALSDLIDYVHVFSHRTQKFEDEQQITLNRKDKDIRRLQDSFQKEQKQMRNFHAKMGTYERQLKEKREDIAILERRVREAEDYQLLFEEERKKVEILEKDLEHERQVIKSLSNELEDTTNKFGELQEAFSKEKQRMPVIGELAFPFPVQQEMPPSMMEGSVTLPTVALQDEQVLNQLANQLQEVLQMAELPEGNFQPAVESYLGSFNELTALEQLMEEYPFVVTQYPTEPDMSLQIMSQWENELFSRLEKQEASKVRREIVNDILRTHPEDIPHRAETIRMTLESSGDITMEQRIEEFGGFVNIESEEEVPLIKQKGKKHETQRKREKQRKHEKHEKAKAKEHKELQEEKKELGAVEKHAKQMKEQHEKEVAEKREKQEKAAKQRQEKRAKEEHQEKLAKEKQQEKQKVELPKLQEEKKESGAIPVLGTKKSEPEESGKDVGLESVREEDEEWEEPMSRSAKRRARKKATQEAISEAEAGLEKISLSGVDPAEIH